MKKLVIILFAYLSIMIISCSTSRVQKTTSEKTLPSQPMSLLTADELQQGQSIFSSSCATCHDLPEPKKYTQDRWTDDILPDMFKKARLDSAQQKLVQGYIFSQLSL